jgi:hypothetical protein
MDANKLVKKVTEKIKVYLKYIKIKYLQI